MQSTLLFLLSIELKYAPSSFGLRSADNFMLPNPSAELFKKFPLYIVSCEWNNVMKLNILGAELR
jgi:hypothetical protein